jgi:putative hydrolases of HD superfamily
MVDGRYIDVGNRKEVAFEEQAERLPQPLAENVVTFIHEYERRTSFEGQFPHDADLLECLIQAREYQAQGHTAVQDWITNCNAGLQSNGARSIADACLSVEPGEGWQGLKSMSSEQK